MCVSLDITESLAMVVPCAELASAVACFPLISVARNIQNIVSAYKSIPVVSSELAIDVLLTFLEGNIHVAVHRLEFAFVNSARVEFYCHRSTNDAGEETGRVLAVIRIVILHFCLVWFSM